MADMTLAQAAKAIGVTLDTLRHWIAPARSSRHATPATAGARLAAADELVSAFALTLVASPQTHRTYRRACRSFTNWLG